MSCLIHARYNMTFDRMTITITQKESGEIQRAWNVTEENIPCIARGISGNGIRVVGSTERWSDVYDDVEVVKMQTGINMSKRDRVRNIRASDGQLAWEDDGVGLEFEVVGSNAVLDPFGKIVEYDVLLMRAEVQ